MDTLIFSKLVLYTFILFFACSINDKQGRLSEFSVSKKHQFSSRETDDYFLLELLGNDVLEDSIIFTIQNFTGNTIYSRKFESTALLDYGIPLSASVKEKEAYIIDRMRHFFDEQNFKDPAIEMDEYDAEDFDLINKSVWDEIKRNKSIGFYYNLYEGDMTWVVFLKSKSRVIKYNSCC